MRKCGVFPCRQKQVGLLVNAVSLFLSKLSSEKVCDPADVADNGKVAFVAKEHPREQLQVSSLISCVTPGAQQISTATL